MARAHHPVVEVRLHDDDALEFSRIDDAPGPRAEARKFAMGKAALAIRRPLIATVALRSLTGMLTLGLAVLFKANDVSVMTAGVILGAGGAVPQMRGKRGEERADVAAFELALDVLGDHRQATFAAGVRFG